MRSVGCMLVCAVCVAAFAAEPKPDKEGFVPLFNGKDLDGWKVMGSANDFKVEDGIIRCETGWGGGCMYYEKRQFSDFVLKVEWRVSPRGNSGVFIRTPTVHDPWTRGYEVQISCEEPRRDDAHCTGALYGYMAVEPRPDETPAKWRAYEITCQGSAITVKVDGKQVCRLDQSTRPETKDKPLEGYVGVQDSHGPAGCWVEYRSIKIKDLAAGK